MTWNWSSVVNLFKICVKMSTNMPRSVSNRLVWKKNESTFLPTGTLGCWWPFVKACGCWGHIFALAPTLGHSPKTGYVTLFRCSRRSVRNQSVRRSSRYFKRYSWLTKFQAFSLNQPARRVASVRKSSLLSRATVGVAIRGCDLGLILGDESRGCNETIKTGVTIRARN